MNYNRIRVDKKWEAIGTWWDPAKPDARFAGELRCSPDNGLRLTVNQMLISPFENSELPPALHGEIDALCPMTLFGPAPAQWHTAGRQEIISALGLVGAHVGSLDEEVFDGISCSTYTLPGWVGNGPFPLPGACNYKPQGARGFVELEFGADPILVLEGGEKDWRQVELAQHFTHQGGGYEATLTCEVYIRIEFSRAMSFGECLKQAHRLELLLTLLTGRASNSHTTILHPSNIKREEGFASATYVESDCPYVGAKTWLPSAQDAGRITMLPTMFKTNGVGVAFSRWETVVEKYEPVLSLLASALYGRGRFAEDRLLLAAQAIEGYCRVECGERYLEKSEFKRLRRSLSKCFDDELDDDKAEAMKAKLAYFNDYSLRDRLLSLFARKPFLLPAIAIRSRSGKPNAEEYTAHLRDARNSLTHVELKGKRRQFAPEYLDALTIRTLNVLCLAVLEEVGITPCVNHPTFQGGYWWDSPR